MKILGVQLLRMGDVLMTLPALRGLRRQFPKAEIHLLINRSCEPIVSVLEGVDKIHYFERDDLQKSLGAAKQSIFLAHDLLAGQVKALNCEGYDRVINFTQNKLSAHLCSVISGSKKSGMHYSKHNILKFNNFWFQALNDRTDDHLPSTIHFADLFQLGAGLQDLQGLDEGAHLSSNASRTLVIQALSNDAKKSLSRDLLRSILRQVDERHSTFSDVKLLAGPGETEILQECLKDLELQRVSAAVVACSFLEAKKIIESSRLLLTTDTSIKHLGSMTKTPIVEVALGGSQIYRTGAYSDRSTILSAKVECFPCSHSSTCPQASHICTEAISGPDVVDICEAIASGSRLELVAKDIAKRINVYQTRIDGTGLWTCSKLGSSYAKAEVSALLERAFLQLRFYRSESHLDLGEGTLVYQVMQFVRDELSSEHKEALLAKVVERKSFLDAFSKSSQQRSRELEAQGRRQDVTKSNVIPMTKERREIFELSNKMKWVTSEMKLIESIYQQLTES